MEKLTQITLTERERHLLAQLVAVATAFLSNIYSNEPFDNIDTLIISRLNNPLEIEALSIKLNLDKIQEWEKRK